MKKSNQHWAKMEERGSRVGLKILLWVYRVFGRRLLWLVLFPVVLFMFLTGSRARLASYQFFKQAHRVNSDVPKPSFYTSLKHFCQFADSAFDKLDAWLNRIKQQDLTYNDSQVFPRLVEQNKGAIFIGSHLGNLEVCRALSYGKYTTKINVLVFTDHAVKFNEMLQSLNDGVAINLIQVGAMSPALAITLKEKVDNGEMIVIVGDRTSVTQQNRVEYVPFLGQDAAFSQGPFILAALLDCPIYWFFCFKEKGGFHVIFEHVSNGLSLPRKQRDIILKEVITAYAERLAYYAVRYPFQWFNFFDFWQKDETVSRRKEK
ncbi:acyltransferase [Thalassotalea sp. 1_MG-2023]|uniref:LpxL/LpxP family acyltransferase n=1 Tax=Thalassotalea sp. 1_MG-2023 TaxID=3062680 RepID=UPI0026E2FC10|nr:acyltransferase [Thalassotalea sp. 1_MG-2023]MDO6426638.1 acyltransferase [Thalassotalea sp. 1_MG-2023]